jgi:hypothetical protein
VLLQVQVQVLPAAAVGAGFPKAIAGAVLDRAAPGAAPAARPQSLCLKKTQHLS